MNIVQKAYAPPRLPAFILGAVIFAIYQIIWRQTLISESPYEYPPATWIAIACALIIGYGLTMLGWFVVQTKGQVRETFRPTRGRLIATLTLFLVTPIGVISYMPWVIGGLLPITVMYMPIYGYGLIIAILAAIYPLAAMIVRHTYTRRRLRFGLIALSFWTAYAAHILVNGVLIFHL